MNQQTTTKKMKTRHQTPTYKIGQKVNFSTKTFGETTIKENKEIKRIDLQEDGTIRYRIAGIGQTLGISLQGDEDLYSITEQNLNNANK